MESSRVLETLNGFRKQAVTEEDFLSCTKHFLKILEDPKTETWPEESSVVVVEALKVCINNDISAGVAEVFALELLGPCLRILATQPRTSKLSEKVFSLCRCCVSRGKPKELFIVVLDEVVNLQNIAKNFFSRVFPIFLLVCIDFLRECQAIFPSDIESILKVIDIAWNNKLSNDIGSDPHLLYEEERDCSHFLENSFMNVCMLSFSVLNLLKDSVMKPKLDRFRVSTTVRCQLVLVILDLIKWVSIFFTDVSIFGTAGKENLNQQELWKYSISLVTLLRELSICRRTQILSLCMLPEETIFQEIFKLQSSLVSTGYIAEMVEEFKEKPCSFLSAGCYLFLSLKSSPFEDDCFLDSKCKLDLYLAPIAALFESKWSAHKVMALWLCKETVSNTVIGFRGNQVLRLLQKAKYRCHLSENISVHDSSLLMIFTLLLQYLDKTAYHNRASYEVINTCIHCLPDPFIKWQVVYFCLMMSTTVGIKAQLLHEMKEAMLKMEDDIDATRALVASSTCFEATENQYRLWSWLSDFLFANFLAPRMSFLEDLPLVSSAIHILAFIIWRLKRQENVAKCKENLECRAKGVRILLSRIVDELYAPSRSPRPDLSFNIPEEMRNRICNESLLCLSLLDQVLLS